MSERKVVPMGGLLTRLAEENTLLRKNYEALKREHASRGDALIEYGRAYDLLLFKHRKAVGRGAYA